MKVTSVETQKKNPRRFNVFLDGKFIFGSDEDTLVKFRLVPGREIFQEELDKILLETEIGKLMVKMYSLFNIRRRSEKEIREKLKIINYRLSTQGDSYSDFVIEKLIENLKEKGLVDDEVFAKEWAISRSRKKGWKVIQSELLGKGINRETIDSVKREALNIKDERETAKNLLEKKMKIWKNPEKRDYKKAISFLMRRGFEFDTAKQAVDEIFEASDS